MSIHIQHIVKVNKTFGDSSSNKDNDKDGINCYYLVNHVHISFQQNNSVLTYSGLRR